MIDAKCLKRALKAVVKVEADNYHAQQVEERQQEVLECDSHRLVQVFHYHRPRSFVSFMNLSPKPSHVNYDVAKETRPKHRHITARPGGLVPDHAVLHIPRLAVGSLEVNTPERMKENKSNSGKK